MYPEPAVSCTRTEPTISRSRPCVFLNGWLSAPFAGLVLWKSELSGEEMHRPRERGARRPTRGWQRGAIDMGSRRTQASKRS